MAGELKLFESQFHGGVVVRGSRVGSGVSTAAAGDVGIATNSARKRHKMKLACWAGNSVVPTPYQFAP